MASKFFDPKTVRAIGLIAAGLVLAVVFHNPPARETSPQPVPRQVAERSPKAAGDVVDLNNRQDEVGGAPRDRSTDYRGKFASLSIDTRTEHPDFGVAGESGEMDDPYSFLLGLAESGDPWAAYLMRGFLRKCARSFRTEEELDAAIVRLYETGLIPSRTGDAVTSGDFNPRSVELRLRKTFARCRSVPDVAIEGSKGWLKHAAYLGLPIAMQEYADSVRRSEPAESVRMYADLWELGSAYGAGGLAQLYETGWPGQSPDPVLAAAYGFISTEFHLAYMRDVGKGFDKPFFDSVKQDIRDLQKKYLASISPREFDAAFEEARGLIEANAHCCKH